MLNTSQDSEFKKNVWALVSDYTKEGEELELPDDEAAEKLIRASGRLLEPVHDLLRKD